MVYLHPDVAPESALPEARRGRVIGRFCLACGAVYRRHAPRHKGKPVYGRDHVASPCSHEGEAFDPHESWWQPAVEVLPEPPASVAAPE